MQIIVTNSAPRMGLAEHVFGIVRLGQRKVGQRGARARAAARAKRASGRAGRWANRAINALFHSVPLAGAIARVASCDWPLGAVGVGANLSEFTFEFVVDVS